METTTSTKLTCPRRVRDATREAQGGLGDVCGGLLSFDDETERYVCDNCGFEVSYFCERCGTPHVPGRFLVCCDFDDMGGNDR